LKTIVQSLSLGSLALLPVSGRVRTLYRALGDENSLCREKLYQKDRLAGVIGRSFWQIPKENLYSAALYQRKLETSGFVAVNVRSIWRDVYPPFVEFARIRLQERELAIRMNPLFRRMLVASLNARRKLSPQAMDYLLVSAVKPVRPV
jgi:hypothetical protein